MNKKVLIVLLALAGPIAAIEDGNWKQTLKQQYEQHLLVLRFPFQHGDQEFDSSGRPLKDPPPDQWQIYGPVFVKKLSVSSDRIRLEGPRVAFGFDQKQKKKIAVPLGNPIQVKIRLDHSLQSANEVEEVLNRIFFPDATTSDYPRPTFLRPGQKVPPDETIYKFGAEKGRVNPPVPMFTPDPDYSDAARKAKLQGTVTLGVVVGKTGTVSRIVIQRALGMGLDEKAVDKIKIWRFKPATRDGQPVPTETSVEVQFNLY